MAIGRRNFLFVGPDSGGERAAAMYSLIGSARLNAMDSKSYLHYVIERIVDHPANPHRRITALERCAKSACRGKSRAHSSNPSFAFVNNFGYGTRLSAYSISTAA